MEYLKALNEKQLQAVKTTEGYLRVIAGAGSGKTKLLVSRYAYLVKEYGIDCNNILCVTFTNKAAGEMKHRVRSLIGTEHDTTMICTYHGFCVKVLREDVEKIFYPKEFRIIDNTQQKSILSEIYSKYELKLDNGSFEKIIKQIALYKSLNPNYVANMCCTDKCQIINEVNSLNDMIIEEYMQHQKKIYAMDFSDLLHFTLDIFRRCPEVLQKWQDRLNYIQVDEFQDSSKTEMRLIDYLSQKHHNLMIVGDPDQNIYEWRGSEVGLLVDFDKDHRPTKTIYLNQNYRSTPQILKCANTLIDKNIYRLKKDLFTNNADGDDVIHFHTKNEYDEADKIIDTITSIKAKTGCNYSDFAVLYRSGFLSRVIEKKFTENGIPYEIFGGVKFYHRMEIQDIMAYLRLIEFEDDVSFKRIINKPRRRFGRIKLQHLQKLQSNGGTLYKTLKDNIADPKFKNSGIKEFIEAIDEIKKLKKDVAVHELIELVCEKSGYEKYIRELGDMERFENLTEFKRIAVEYEASLGEPVTLNEFINQIALQSNDEASDTSDSVKLMTIHSAKGLEFENVFVVGLSEGVFPSSKTIEERKDIGLEEERRLCYVAITRAQKRLFLLDNEGFTQSGNQKFPSRFLKEIGEENYHRIGTIPKELSQETQRCIMAQETKTPVANNKNIGDTVHHPAFGDGKIIGFEKNKNSYKIRFENSNCERNISADFFSSERSLPSLDFPKTPDETKNTDNKSAEASSSLSKGETKTQTKSYFDSLKDFKEVESKTISELLPTQDENQNSDQQPVVNQPSDEVTTEPAVYENLWENPNVPKTGWRCTGVTDLKKPVGVCQMCGHPLVRYMHHMEHESFRPLYVGCYCAGRMEGNIEGAKRRENDFKNKENRRENFKNRKWKTSKNNNSYIKIKDHLIVLYYNENQNCWKYSLDNVFCVEVFTTREEAMDAAFDALEKALHK